MFHDKCEAREAILWEALDRATRLTAKIEGLIEVVNKLESCDCKIEAVPIDPTYASNVPLFMSEEEEDLKYQVDSGIIDKELASEILKHAGYDNTEVQFDR